jgi:hypothetical protein
MTRIGARSPDRAGQIWSAFHPTQPAAVPIPDGGIGARGLGAAPSLNGRFTIAYPTRAGASGAAASRRKRPLAGPVGTSVGCLPGPARTTGSSHFLSFRRRRPTDHASCLHPQHRHSVSCSSRQWHSEPSGGAGFGASFCRSVNIVSALNSSARRC